MQCGNPSNGGEASATDAQHSPSNTHTLERVLHEPVVDNGTRHFAGCPWVPHSNMAANFVDARTLRGEFHIASTLCSILPVPNVFDPVAANSCRERWVTHDQITITACFCKDVPILSSHAALWPINGTEVASSLTALRFLTHETHSNKNLPE